MDKATLNKKSVLALERLAKKVGANVVDPKTGKKKNKVSLINGIIMAERLGGKKKPARKTLGAKPASNVFKAPNATELKRLSVAIKKLEAEVDKALNKFYKK
jgi:hypothetical protein